MNRSKYESLIEDIVEGLENQFSDSKCYFDITRQEVLYIDDMSFEQDLLPEDGDELLSIEPLPSFESFRIMEDFADSIEDEKLQEQLFRTLGRSHPFSRFKDDVYDSGISDEWFLYKSARMKEFAREWMNENKVEYIDGRFICKSNRGFLFDREEFM